MEPGKSIRPRSLNGLHHVLKVNPGVQICIPVEPANFDTPVGPGLANLIRRRVIDKRVR